MTRSDPCHTLLGSGLTVCTPKCEAEDGRYYLGVGLIGAEPGSSPSIGVSGGSREFIVSVVCVV